MSAPPAKKLKLNNHESAYSSASASGSDISSSDSETEMYNMKPKKSLSTSKRKLRATTTSNFGATLQSLLHTDAPSNLPLSLKPGLSKLTHEQKERKQIKLASQIEKKDHEDVSRVTDVIGGWGGQSERELRKIAQRGVVKLFNVIQQAQIADTAVTDSAKANRGSGKPTLPAPSTKAKNIKDASVSQNEFFNMLKSGSVVSKT